MMNKNDILKKLPLNSLPHDWIWNDNEINQTLESTYCCIILASAAVFDAILSKCIVINMQRELSGMGNFSDQLQDKFPLLKEVPDYKLSDRIKDAYENGLYYQKEFKKVQKYLKSSYNQVNDNSMEVFLKDFPTKK